ncbi:hypothetical protein [Bradyrhizobium sp.]|jgi:general secretion pathway protein N|uniref:hypothetical protein n=1 Tax=Bradyrhizobium sp. TaxID=376 RepID=UPI003C1A79AD
MKLRILTCIVMLALSAEGAAALTSLAARDPIDSDLARDAREADNPATTSIPLHHAGPARPVVTPAAPAAQRTLGANPLWAVPLSALTSTRDRPIFSSSRRPPPSAVAAAAVPNVAAAPKPKEPERPQLSLVGTIANGLEQFGIFLNQSTAAALRLRVGEEFQGWKLSSVQGREATLEKDTQVVVLSLPQPGSTPAEALARLNPGLPGQLLSAPQPRLRLKPNRQM